MVFLRIIVGRRDRQLRVAERERELARREAVVEERARIARELHDAIAHHVSMMVVQAGAERRVLDPGPGVDAGGAVDDRAGGPKRAHRDAAAGRDAPQRRRRRPRAAAEPRGGAGPGRRVCATPASRSSCRWTASGASCRSGIELSAYRVVQEGLTNALKHAGRGARRGPHPLRAGRLELEIADDGGGGTGDVPGGGQGLVGIRERVALYGGELEAGPAADGGFGSASCCRPDDAMTAC